MCVCGGGGGGGGGGGAEWGGRLLSDRNNFSFCKQVNTGATILPFSAWA